MKNKIMLFMAIAFIAFGFGIKFFSKPEVQQTAKVKPSLSVSVETPTIRKMVNEVKVSGGIVPWQESVINAELQGLRIENIYVDVGDIVEKGQVLAELDIKVLASELMQAKASLLEAQANLRQAKENADRARALSKTDALSGQQYTQYLTTELVSQAKVESAKALLESYNTRMQQAKILSPDDGVVSSRTAAVGNLVNQSEMFRVIRQNKLQWLPTVSFEKLLLIKKDFMVSINLPNGQTIEAPISAIAPKIDRQTRQATLIVDLMPEVHKNLLQSGMFVEGKISLGEINALMVPQQAVILRDGINYVFVFSDGKVHQKKVVIGIAQDSFTQILSGLEDGEQIVVSGAGFLNDGDVVHLVK